MEIIPILEISPYPIVDLDSPAKPKDGLFLQVNNFCSRKYSANNTCRDFYASIRNKPVGLHVCPFGFCCLSFKAASRPFAFSCFIPWPRHGGLLESQRAKDQPKTKVAIDSLQRAALALQSAEMKAEAGYLQEIKKYPAAFHELIKLNGAVKQHAELLLQANENDPSIKTIFSSAEMMSRQFEILELVANQELAKLPVRHKSTLKQLIYKCIKIYETRAEEKGIKFEKRLDEGDITVCNKTFPIIPFVLIDNAIRYSKEHGVIRVTVESRDGYCELRVSNKCNTPIHQERLFRRNSRGNEGEGSGNGLYLAQLVANQHASKIEFTQSYSEVTFSVRFKQNAPGNPRGV